MSVTLRQIVVQSGKLNSWVAQWMGSYSTAARTSNPACWNPRLKPPAPANKSTTNGRDFMELASQLKWRVRITASVNNSLPVEKTAHRLILESLPRMTGEYKAKMINLRRGRGPQTCDRHYGCD